MGSNDENIYDSEINNTEIELFETNVIDDIDANEYLELESENPNDIEGDIECEKYESSDVMGKIFDTPEDAYVFYNRYAFLHGFGIRKCSSFKNKTTNENYRKKYVCNKEGFKDLKINSSGGDVKKRRRDLRTGCEAMFRISKKKDEKWVVDIFNDSHNHELSVTPTKVMKHRSHGKFHRSLACKSLMSELGQSGLRPCQIKKVVNTMKPPHESDVTSKQCSDILGEQRKQYKGKEFYGLIKHFQDKSRVDSNQYFEMDLFDDGSPRNLFWADGRSRDSYIKFGDVVVFDVTYMTNRFKMPFSPFVGVNHHNQSILFGGALLENEKQETFEWLFRNFLKCMFDKHPSAIMTDQDKAMGNAIKIVFPNTRHRYCAWHINKHELEHLRPLKSRYTDFEELYRQCVRSDNVEQFETRWKVIFDKFNLESNSWIKEMYNQRHKWVKAFFKDVFLAGMTTSGRSESIHSFFDGYVNSKTMLNEFVVQYDKAVESRRAAEEDEDFKTMNSKPNLSSVNPIEAKAGARYTRKIFDDFEKKWIEATNNLTHKTISKNSEEIIYKVGQMNIEQIYWRLVKFRFLDKVDITCSCASFETSGLVCKHMLYVMKKRDVDLPDHYILPRWTLDVRYRVDRGSIRLEDVHSEEGVSALTLWCVQENYNKAIEQARDSSSEIKKINTFLVNFLEKQKIRKQPSDYENASQDYNEGSSQVQMMPRISDVGSSQVNIMTQISVRDPQVLTNTKGRPKNATRIKSSLEAPKKRTCSYCKGLGHYVSGCQKKKVDDLERERKRIANQ